MKTAQKQTSPAANYRAQANQTGSQAVSRPAVYGSVSSPLQRKPIIQRIVPTLDQTIGWGFWETPEKLKPVFLNTIVLLKGQLMRNKPAIGTANRDEWDRLITMVDTRFEVLNKGVELKTEDVDELIGMVNGFEQKVSIGNNQVQASSLRALEADEKPKFSNLIQKAIDSATKALNDNAALEATFSLVTTVDKAKTSSQAKENFRTIIAHLQFWERNMNQNVAVNTSNAGYGGFNRGKGENSVLTINQKAFDDIDKSAYTLIHEASHAVLGTRDLGYIGVPYFFTLPDQFRLANADHYSYAAQLANNKLTLADDNEIIHADPLQKNFSKAIALACFKAERIWTYLMWMKEVYGDKTKGYVPEITLKKHEKWVNLEGRSDVLKAASVELLITYYSIIKGYLTKDIDLQIDPSNSVEMTPKDGSKAIKVANVDTTKSIDEISGLIIDDMFASFGFPAQWNVQKVGNKLFSRLFMKGKDLRDGDKPPKVEKDLYDWFKTA